MFRARTLHKTDRILIFKLGRHHPETDCLFSFVQFLILLIFIAGVLYKVVYFIVIVGVYFACSVAAVVIILLRFNGVTSDL